MAGLQAINFGPPVEDTSRWDAGAARGALEQRGNETQRAVQDFGKTVTGDASELMQATAHAQAAQASLASRQGEGQVLDTIERNPTVTVGQLTQGINGLPPVTSQGMSAIAEHERVTNPNFDPNDPRATVHMFNAAKPFYDDHMSQIDAEAGKQIALPGWRNAWHTAAQEGHEDTRSNRVDKVAAQQQVQWLTETGKATFNGAVNAAEQTGNFSFARSLAETTPTIKNDPLQYQAAVHAIDVADATYKDREAVRGGPTEQGLAQLRGSIATLKGKDGYPGLTQPERDQHLDSLTKIADQWGGSVDAQKALLAPGMILDNGKVNPHRVNAMLQDSTDQNFNRELQRRVSENDHQVEVENAGIADRIKTMGTVTTGPDGKQRVVPFSMKLVNQTPGGPEMLVNLAKRDPTLAAALVTEDATGVRRQKAMQATDDRAEAAERRADLTQMRLASKGNLADATTDLMDHPEAYRDMGSAEYTAQLVKKYPGGLTPEDQMAIKGRFEKLQKDQDKPGEKPWSVIGKAVGAMGLDSATRDTLQNQIFSNHEKWEQTWREDHHGRAPNDQDLLDFISRETRPGSVTNTGMISDRMTRASFEAKQRAGELTSENEFEPSTPEPEAAPPYVPIDRAPGPTRVKSDADFAKLRSGTVFIAPDGSKRTKP